MTGILLLVKTINIQDLKDNGGDLKQQESVKLDVWPMVCGHGKLISGKDITVNVAVLFLG